ncbi:MULTISPECIES: hypothetical protein [unclassified Streptomyces]|uniref:hypothetical protein n=1 Tax=unclassified Streptomyces TaxID=2593676 RepID=UPI000BF0A2DE|nr:MULTISPECIES: hypothetical protein [unclassified Streptomyces]
MEAAHTRQDFLLNGRGRARTAGRYMDSQRQRQSALPGKVEVPKDQLKGDVRGVLDYAARPDGVAWAPAA